MRCGFYPRLALDGIRKNKRLYFPYIFTGGMMVMMFYILSFLSESPALVYMEGSTTLSAVLPLGSTIIAAFSVLFLFYTNSFLLKQRYREFGLYNILGMDKKNICRLMAWETLFVGAIAIAGGIVTGVVLSKAAELILLNLLNMAVSYRLSVGLTAIWQTAAVFGCIYGLLLLNALWRVSRSRPLELMQSSKAGERVLKRTWMYALVGLVLLAAAYFLAVSIEDPLDALLWFFVAVLLVIAGTYLLFISGSVAFCKLLQANKAYYYRPNHFVSVSSMVYRMKRNGAGLASICILLTMVLVMITSTSCLYFGAEDALEARCSNDVNISLRFRDLSGIAQENLDKIRDFLGGYSGSEADLMGIRTCELPGFITEGGMIFDIDATSGLTDWREGYLAAVPLEDYNHQMGTEVTLAPDECLLYCSRLDLRPETFTVQYGNTYNVREVLEDYRVDGETLAMTIPAVYLIVADLEDFAQPLQKLTYANEDQRMVLDWNVGFDTDLPETELAVQVNEELIHLVAREEDGLDLYSQSVFSRAERRAHFYDMYGSLFFLGIMLSIVFLVAAVLIIYYKQLCEGFEDQARFEIMQKVGMTKVDIRKSINSQMLTVLFLPLLLAGMHLAFAFPFVSKILLVFAFDNTALSVAVNLSCFGMFGVFYGLVYRITSSVYYSIVSSGRS